MNRRPYDVTVYGASGFTGQFVAAEAARTLSGKKLAIAGRNKAKLQKVIGFIQKELGKVAKPFVRGKQVPPSVKSDVVLLYIIYILIYILFSVLLASKSVDSGKSEQHSTAVTSEFVNYAQCLTAKSFGFTAALLGNLQYKSDLQLGKV